MNITEKNNNESLFRVMYILNLKKPKLVLKLIKAYLNLYLFGYHPPKYIDFAFDYRCNLHCKGCFAQAFAKLDRPKMNMDDYKKVIEEANDIGCFYFDFQGGEPLLPATLPILKKLVKMTKPEQNIISITTNGTCLNEENVLKLKEWKVDNITVSLDSGFAREHDAYRGAKGTFDKAIKGIYIAQRHGLRVAVNTIITHKYLYSVGFQRLLAFCEDRDIVINTLIPVPIGSWENNKKIVLNDEDFRYLAKLRKKHSLLRRDEDGMLVGWGCPAGKEMLHINAFGDVLPCAFVHISFGNVLNESLDTIHNRMMRYRYFSPDESGECLLARKEFMEKYIKTVNENEKPVHYNRVRWLE